VAGMKAFFHRKAEATVDVTLTNEQKVFSSIVSLHIGVII
jgi:hypothetical protein